MSCRVELLRLKYANLFVSNLNNYSETDLTKQRKGRRIKKSAVREGVLLQIDS